MTPIEGVVAVVRHEQQVFIPCMDYFTEAERQAILGEEWEFDRNLIHEKYKNIGTAAEKELTSRTL